MLHFVSSATLSSEGAHNTTSSSHLHIVVIYLQKNDGIHDCICIVLYRANEHDLAGNESLYLEFCSASSSFSISMQDLIIEIYPALNGLLEIMAPLHAVTSKVELLQAVIFLNFS